MAGEHGKRDARRAHQPEAVSDWLNPFSLGTTRGGPCQHGFMCGCRQWSNDINESN